MTTDLCARLEFSDLFGYVSLWKTSVVRADFVRFWGFSRGLVLWSAIFTWHYELLKRPLLTACSQTRPHGRWTRSKGMTWLYQSLAFAPHPILIVLALDLKCSVRHQQRRLEPALTEHITWIWITVLLEQSYTLCIFVLHNSNTIATSPGLVQTINCVRKQSSLYLQIRRWQ